MAHVAIIGAGRVGQALAYTLMFEPYVSELSLVDIAPRVAKMAMEELYHGLSAHNLDVEIRDYESSKFVEDADLIIISAGYPRKPGMSRRDLADENAKIIKEIMENTLDNNPRAWYFVITNPVDALTTLAYKISEGKRKIIGTGTNLETARFRTILSRHLEVPLKSIEGYVGGEHGEAAVLLWSTVKVNGAPLDEYLKETGISIDKVAIEKYVKGISMEVIKVLGGTRWGPAGSFLEIIRGIMLNTGRIISFALPRKFNEIPEPVYVTVPGKIGRSLGPDLWNILTEEERDGIKKAAVEIYKTYLRALKVTGLCEK